jgi:hypothetical protein
MGTPQGRIVCPVDGEFSTILSDVCYFDRVLGVPSRHGDVNLVKHKV